MAGAEKSKKMFEKLFDKALAEMRQRHEKLNSQVAQWVSRAENELGIDASLKGLSGRMEQLHKTQLETMGQWQKEFESRFQQMLDFQKQMLDSLLPGSMKSDARTSSAAASAPLVKQDVTPRAPAKPAVKAGKTSAAKAAKSPKAPKVSVAESADAKTVKAVRATKVAKTAAANVADSKNSEPKTARKKGGSKKAASGRAASSATVTSEAVGQSAAGEADAASANDSSGQA
jgi:hypothetical protein